MMRSIAILTILLLTQSAFAGFSPKTEDELYNKGLELLLELKFRKAEKQFRKALKIREDFGEAHNNLAYCLRKQGADHFQEALQHYDRAVALIPEAEEPYMYRGVLHVSMGSKEKASADLARLVELGAGDLVKELSWVIENEREKEPEQFFGVSPAK